MNRPKKLHSFRMNQRTLVALKQIAKEKKCSQISIVEDSLNCYFKQYTEDLKTKEQ